MTSGHCAARYYGPGGSGWAASDGVSGQGEHNNCQQYQTRRLGHLLPDHRIGLHGRSELGNIPLVKVSHVGDTVAYGEGTERQEWVILSIEPGI